MHELLAENAHNLTNLVPPPSPDGPFALFLDLDGTLIPIADRPDAVVVPDALPLLLARLAERLDGRLAIISGRSLATIDSLLGLGMIAASGSHGLELRNTDGTITAVTRPDTLDEALCELEVFAGQRPGMLVERKPLGVGIHYRGAPEQADEAEQLVECLASIHRLKVQRGKMVFELRPRGADKGTALRRFMDDPVFAGALPWFVGDDVTDEPAFIAARDLGGGAVLVGEARPTAATYRLPDVDAVHAWLDAMDQAK
ncbi:trehalose-phosphatase [Sphingomonas sp. FW199]|uniref:trehalose-phosphatase n=1 Tax=Sphingomonas sp. FW199 TaxID=3400217 RepID=UPI003CF666DC